MKLLKYSLLLTMLVISGCWDRTEINDLAFVMGTALDLTDDGNILCTLQVAIPSAYSGGSSGGGGGMQEKHFIISAEGKNGNDIHRLLQKESSRRLFFSHRSIVLISERLAKHGIQDTLDIFTHDPRNRLKTYIMLVKGGDAKTILQMKYPLKQIPIEAVKEIEGSGDDLAVTLRDFYISLLTEGLNPVIGVIEPAINVNEMQRQASFRFTGAAAFKNLKLSGLLDERETLGYMWVTDKLKFSRLTAKLPEGNGEVGIMLTHADRKIITQIQQESVKFKIVLDGQGSLVENNSSLNISEPKDLKIMKEALEDASKRLVEDILFKIQKKYKVDCVGFGQEVYKNNPELWTTLKDKWEGQFPETDIQVEVNLTIKGAGMVNSTLELQEKENDE